MIEKKFTKHCVIGEKVFDIAINRSMAIKAHKENPEYWDYMTKSQAVQDILNEKKAIGEISATDFNTKEAFELLELSDKMEEASANIVRFILPEMLKFADFELPEGYSCYKDYADSIIAYCDENGVLYNYIIEVEDIDEAIEADEEEFLDIEPIIAEGFYTQIMKFINLGFTNGGKKKSAVKIIMN